MKRKLKVAIDASGIKSDGGINHLNNILKFVDLSKENISKVYIWSFKESKLNFDPLLNIDHIEISSKYEFFIKRLFWQFFILPNEKKFIECDVVFLPAGIAFYSRKPTVLFLQNLLPFRLNEMIKYRSIKTLTRLSLVRIAQTISSHFAKSIIFPSNYSKEIILNSMFFNKDIPTYIIHHGVSYEFYSNNKTQSSIDKYSSNNPFVISYISIIDVYKNHFNLFKAVSLLIKRDKIPIQLQFIGAAESFYAKRLVSKLIKLTNKEQWFKYIPHVKYEFLPEIYQGSNLLINASSCESFGMSALESLASGVPNCASKNNVYYEIFANSANYFDPLEIEDIYRSLKVVINSVSIRKELLINAKERLKTFSWQKSSIDTFDVIRRAFYS
tara:strand:+ start:775 stop:1929 length:1155 start_codon:yes stop_codon:yes gene_type:complete